MVAVLAHEPLSAKNKTSSSPTSTLKPLYDGGIKNQVLEGGSPARPGQESFRLTNKALNDVLHGVTSKTYRPVTKQASASSRFSTGAGTKQSQSIEPGIFSSQFSSYHLLPLTVFFFIFLHTPGVILLLSAVQKEIVCVARYTVVTTTAWVEKCLEIWPST